MVRSRLVKLVASALAVAVVGLLACALPAQAANGVVGQRMEVCADSLAVRTAPLGPWMGTLYKPQTFLVEQLDGDWVRGFAYGDINRDGWVQNGWFC
jgi:hypothetical protein